MQNIKKERENNKKGNGKNENIFPSTFPQSSPKPKSSGGKKKKSYYY